MRTAVQDLERRGIIAREVPTLRDRAHARRTTAYRFTIAGRLEVPRPVEARPHELPPLPVEGAPELPVEVEHQAPPDDGPELLLGAAVLVDLDAAEVTITEKGVARLLDLVGGDGIEELGSLAIQRATVHPRATAPFRLPSLSGGV